MKKVRTRNILVTQLRFLLRQKHYLFKEKNESEENRMYKAYIARWAKDEKDGPKTLNQRLESQNYTIYAQFSQQRFWGTAISLGQFRPYTTTYISFKSTETVYQLKRLIQVYPNSL